MECNHWLRYKMSNIHNTQMTDWNNKLPYIQHFESYIRTRNHPKLHLARQNHRSACLISGHSKHNTSLDLRRTTRRRTAPSQCPARTRRALRTPRTPGSRRRACAYRLRIACTRHRRTRSPPGTCTRRDLCFLPALLCALGKGCNLCYLWRRSQLSTYLPGTAHRCYCLSKGRTCQADTHCKARY